MYSPAEENLRAGRVKLNGEHSYLAAAVWALRFEEAADCPTMGVSKHWTCYFNPQAVGNWPIPSIVTVLVHEIWHLLRRHHERAEALGITEATLEAWNIACDAEINDGLIEAGLKFPPGIQPITPEFLGLPPHLLAEEYYARLPKSKGGSGGSGQGQGQGQGQSSGQGKGQGKGTVGGSGADSVARPWEKDSGSGNQSGNGQDKGKSGTPGQVPGTGKRIIPEELIRKQVAEQINRTPGSLPGNWRRWSGQILAPKVIPWQVILRNTLGRILTAGKREEYTFNRPARRAAAGFIFPGQTGTLPEIITCVDTSGSMSDDNLSESLGIVESVLEYLGRIAPIVVITGDTVPQSTQSVVSSKNVNLQGGGGTDMRALMEYARKRHPKPQVIVVITDGFTPWPDSPPTGIKTVVVLVADGQSPDWAVTVKAGKREEG